MSPEAERQPLYHPEAWSQDLLSPVERHCWDLPRGGLGRHCSQLPRGCSVGSKGVGRGRD